MAKNFLTEIVELGVGGPLILTGSADPRAGAGVAAPVGAYYIRTGASFDWYQKVAAGNTAWIPTLTNGFSGFFGDGSDGNLTVPAGTTNEASVTGGDVFYENLTIQAGGTYRSQGRRIWIRDTLTIEATGDWNANGTPAVGAVAGTAVVGYLFNAGTAGGAGQAAAGANGVNTAAVILNAGAATGIGGAGGAGSGGAGGAAGTITANAVNGSMRDPVHAPTGFSAGATQAGLGSGTGGGGGGGDGAALGGGGGGGGGVILIMARRVINNGTIRSIGGNGAAGTANNCGGGGGGGGGRILICARSFDASGGGTIVVTGGALGASGGGAGVAGAAGANGFSLIIPV